MKRPDLLIDKAEARELSSRLYHLGDQIYEICAELDSAGYGAPSRAVRKALKEMAASEVRRQQLKLYWMEYAKERLAGLAGPMDIFSGKLPSVAAYRSPLLSKLRTRVANGQLRSTGSTRSPQIEPTMKRYVEMMRDDSVMLRINAEVKEARKVAARALALPELENFPNLRDKERYALLQDRYSAILRPAGFNLASRQKIGLVFRKPTSNGRWDFLFVDDSRDGVDVGMLSVTFALTVPQKAVTPNALPLCTVATFSPNDIVPGFRSAQVFAERSFAEFCLAADACAYLASILYRRVDALLCDPIK